MSRRFTTLPRSKTVYVRTSRPPEFFRNLALVTFIFAIAIILFYEVVLLPRGISIVAGFNWIYSSLMALEAKLVVPLLLSIIDWPFVRPILEYFRPFIDLWWYVINRASVRVLLMMGITYCIQPIIDLVSQTLFRLVRRLIE